MLQLKFQHGSCMVLVRQSSNPPFKKMSKLENRVSFEWLTILNLPFSRSQYLVERQFTQSHIRKSPGHSSVNPNVHTEPLSPLPSSGGQWAGAVEGGGVGLILPLASRGETQIPCAQQCSLSVLPSTLSLRGQGNFGVVNTWNRKAIFREAISSMSNGINIILFWKKGQPQWLYTEREKEKHSHASDSNLWSCFSEWDFPRLFCSSVTTHPNWAGILYPVPPEGRMHGPVRCEIRGTRA